jgi:hypothetical protein
MGQAFDMGEVDYLDGEELGHRGQSKREAP